MRFIWLSLMATASAWAQGVNFYSVEKEAALGKQLAAEVERGRPAVEDPRVQRYVGRIGQELAVQMPEAQFAFTFRVLADDWCPSTHEPQALPGGYVFVSAALLLAARDEAEFAGMMAHAMEHVAQRHATRQATRGQLVNYGSVPLVFIGGWSGNCSGGAAVPVGFLAMQRVNELQSDSLGVRAASRAGFDPAGLLRYIEREQTAPRSPVFSTLPAKEQRQAALRAVIATLPAHDYVVSTGDFAVVQGLVRESSPWQKHP